MRPKRPLVVDEDGVVCRPRGNTPCGGGVVGVVAVGSVAIRTPQLGRLARAGPGAPRATIAPCASKVNSPTLRGQETKISAARLPQTEPTRSTSQHAKWWPRGSLPQV